MEVLARQEIDNPIPISSEFVPTRGEPTRRSITPNFYVQSSEIIFSHLTHSHSRQAETTQSIVLTTPSNKMSAPNTFTPFPKLPIELQRDIWKLVVGAELRIITFPGKKGKVIGVLHACHLARSMAKKDYKLVDYREHGKSREWTIRINFKVDIVYFLEDMPGAVASFQMPSLCNSIEKLAVSRLSHLSVFYINRGLEYNRQWLKWFRVMFPKVEEFTFIVNASGQQHGEYGDLVQSHDLPTINLFRDCSPEVQCYGIQKTVGSK
jgi:hypothetical protein